MPNEHISLDDIYNNPAAGGSVFKAVKMMAEEARFINEQARAGWLNLELKPTTIAMRKFNNHRIEIVETPPEEPLVSAEGSAEASTEESVEEE